MSTTVTITAHNAAIPAGQTIVLSAIPDASQSRIEHPDGESAPTPSSDSSKLRFDTAVVLTLVCLMQIISNIINGILSIGLPKMAASMNLSDGLLLWPASVYSLSCACTLLLSGSLSDLFGPCRMYLLGSFLSMALILACGLARDGIQLIIFRALQGIAASLFLPASVSIVTRTFPPGRLRNIAFASLGGAQPAGFLLGLVLGGIVIDTIGWRTGMYIISGVNGVVLLVSFFSLPLSQDVKLDRTILPRVRKKVDWTGVLLISVSLGLLSYVLSAICSVPSSVTGATNMTLLIVSLLLLVGFATWEHFQEKNDRPALIPNSIWRNPTFTSTCVLGFFSWATSATNQYFLALVFERLQGYSALQTSLRFLPLVLGGVLANIATGAMVRHVRADLLIGGSAVLSAATPLIMASVVIGKPHLSYWAAAFPAAILSPIWADVTLTIANIVITRLFPPSLHGLAGGISNTCAQLGTSIGLNLTALLANAVTKNSSSTPPVEALAEGYKAAFWTTFAGTIAMVFLTVFGMRKVGKVGRTKDD